MQRKQTKESQYSLLYDVVDQHGIATFGLMSNESWNQDPRRTVFTLSRYKFVSKMLKGKRNVLEVGCADAFASRIVQQEVDKLTVVDFDQIFIDDIESRKNPKWPLIAFQHDMLTGPVPGNFDAAFLLDVLEHIDPKNEDIFLRNICDSVGEDSPVIIGMPSIESQKYASAQSKIGHVNCKSGDELKLFLEEYFKNVFLFSMNDEVIHTGYYPMAHYLMAVCV